MKILVPVKRVVDAYVRIRVKSDGSGVDLAGAKMAMNPFDEIALEEAIRLVEDGTAQEVVAVSVGTAQAIDTIRTGLAMGADRGILISTEDRLEPLTVAKLLKALIAREQPDLVIMGKQAIDDDCNQTGQMLAGLLNWPQATFASRIEPGAGTLRVRREVDGGEQIVNLPLPAIVTAELRLNEPRFASLPAIMKAKKKSVEQIEAAALGIDTTPRLKVLKTVEPGQRSAGAKLGSAAELVEALSAKGVLA